MDLFVTLVKLSPPNPTPFPFQSPIEEEAKPRTWCNKIPRQICAPENCHMEQGEPECREIVLESTVKKPEEVCDLQPTKQCHQVTNLVPHLEQQVVCKEIPKEVCHLRLDTPKIVQRPVTLKWCTKPEASASANAGEGSGYGAPPPSSYGAPQVTLFSNTCKLQWPFLSIVGEQPCCVNCQLRLKMG